VKKGSGFVPWRFGESKAVWMAVRGSTGSRQNAKWTLKIVKQAVINQPMVSREERIKRNAVVPDHECRNAHGLQASV
jgi:hypothetical protein